jgi:ribosomal protein S18 acetylase RimI-like enzyme
MTRASPHATRWIHEVGVGWVETDDSDHAVAYLLLEQIDERAHIEQVTVHPDVARRGIGAA